MLHWRQEGEYLRNGLNVYHPKDQHSLGGMLRIGKYIWRIRYSKLAKKWSIGYNRVDTNAYTAWEEQHGLKHD